MPQVTVTFRARHAQPVMQGVDGNVAVTVHDLRVAVGVIEQLQPDAQRDDDDDDN